MQLAQRQPDGSTLRDHLVAAQGAGAASDPRLSRTLPPNCSALWQAFNDLGAARPSGFGAACVPPSEIVAWQHLHGVALTPWEIETLMAMDRAAVSVVNEANRKRAAK